MASDGEVYSSWLIVEISGMTTSAELETMWELTRSLLASTYMSTRPEERCRRIIQGRGVVVEMHLSYFLNTEYKSYRKVISLVTSTAVILDIVRFTVDTDHFGLSSNLHPVSVQLFLARKWSTAGEN
jgi:hypothetical protein